MLVSINKFVNIGSLPPSFGDKTLKTNFEVSPPFTHIPRDPENVFMQPKLLWSGGDWAPQSYESMTGCLSWLTVSTHLKKILLKMGIFPKFRGEHKKYLSCHHLVRQLKPRHITNSSSLVKAHWIPSTSNVSSVEMEELCSSPGRFWPSRQNWNDREVWGHPRT